MERSKKVIFACHCLLNQNARAKGVAKAPGVIKEFIDCCMANDYGIVPIDCPQLHFEPLNREPENKEFYDKQEFRKICNDIAKFVIKNIKTYKNNDYEVAGVVGVEGSPTCAAVKTHITKEGQTAKVNAMGIFFEELKKELDKDNLDVPFYDWDNQDKKLLSKEE